MLYATAPTGVMGGENQFSDMPFSISQKLFHPFTSLSSINLSFREKNGIGTRVLNPRRKVHDFSSLPQYRRELVTQTFNKSSITCGLFLN